MEQNKSLQLSRSCQSFIQVCLMYMTITHCVYFRPQIHREKRKFLRTALKELGTVFTDQPGLLGPKVCSGVFKKNKLVPNWQYRLRFIALHLDQTSCIDCNTCL